MDDFSTYEGALDIFKKVDCVGEQQNIIFGAMNDISSSKSFVGSMIGNITIGTMGSIIGEEIGRELDLNVSKINGYIMVLFNFTENGVGIMPVNGPGFYINPQKMSPVYDGYVYFNYQELAKIKVNNYLRITKRKKTITLILANKNKLVFIADKGEKYIPYQVENIEKFAEKYQKD